MEWRIGERVVGTYEVLGVLGRGGMGVVYHVRHLNWNIDLAAKLPLTEVLRRPRARQGLVREAETWVSIGLHPHVCACHYVRMLGGLPVVFAEYMDRGSVADWIDDRRLYKGDQVEVLVRILDLVIQTAWGLAHSHTLNVVHKDVKPANILLNSEGTAKLTDFGIAGGAYGRRAAVYPADTLSVTNERAMSPPYASPEQLLGARLGRRSDLWSLAVTVLHTLIGSRPWRYGWEADEVLASYRGGGFPEAQVSKIPAALDDLLHRCLRKKPEGRPGDMIEVAAELAEVYADEAGHPYLRTVPRQADLRADELNNRALSLLDLGRAEEAESAFEEAAAVDPRHPEVTFNRGLLRWRDGSIADDVLVTDLEACRDAAPGGDIRRVAALLARVHAERGDAAAARLVDASSVIDEEASRQDIRRVLELGRDKGGLTAVCTTPDGRHIVAVTTDGTARQWELDTGRYVRSFRHRRISVSDVCLTPDGGALIAVGNRVLTWNLDSGRIRRAIRARGPLASVCVTADGRFALTTGLSDDRVSMWHLHTGRFVRAFDGQAGCPGSVCTVPGLPLALVGGEFMGETVRIWDLYAGHCVGVIGDHREPVSSILAMPGGQTALIAGGSGTIYKWDLASRQYIGVLRGHTSPVTHLNATHDDRYTLSTAIDNTVRIWETATGRCIRTIENPHAGLGYACATADGRHALIPGGGGAVQVQKLGKGATATFQLCTPRSAVELTRMVSRVQTLVAEAKQAIAVGRLPVAYDLLTDARRQSGHERDPAVVEAWRLLGTRADRTRVNAAWEAGTLQSPPGNVHEMCVTSDGSRVLAATANGSVRVWDLLTRSHVHDLRGHAGAVNSVCVTSDDRHVLGGGEDATARVWDMATGAAVAVLRGHTEPVCSVRETPDGRHVISASRDGTARVWDLDTGECVRVLEGNPGPITSVDVISDGRVVTAGFWDYSFRTWDFDSGRCLRVYPSPTTPVASVHAIPGGERVLTTAGMTPNRDVSIWDLANGRRVLGLEGRQLSVTSVCVTTDGRHAVTADSEGVVRMWDLAAGECMQVLNGHVGAVTAVCVTPGADHILSAGMDQCVRVWKVDWQLQLR